MAAELSPGLKIKKFVLMFLNIIFMIVGIVLIVGGVVVQTNKSFEYVKEFTTGFATFGIAMIIIGVIVFIIAFLGCFGAWRESWCLLFVYGFIILAILIIAIIIVIVAAVKKGSIESEIRKKMHQFVNEYDGKGKVVIDKTNVTKVWDEVQKGLECCGVNKYKDFERNTTWAKTHEKNELPITCCRKEVPKDATTCTYDPKDEKFEKKKIWNRGCFYKMEDVLADNATVIIVCFVIFLVVLLLIVTMSCCLAGGIRRKKKYENIK